MVSYFFHYPWPITNRELVVGEWGHMWFLFCFVFFFYSHIDCQFLSILSSLLGMASDTSGQVIEFGKHEQRGGEKSLWLSCELESYSLSLSGR